MFLIVIYINKILKLKLQFLKINLIKCCPLNVIGDPDIKPLSFKNAIIEPENVIAPIAAPKDISIKLASFISPTA